MKGLETALIETAFRLRRKSRSFSPEKRRFSYSSMLKALTIRVPEIVSCRRVIRLPRVTCVRVATCRIFWPNLAIG